MTLEEMKIEMARGISPDEAEDSILESELLAAETMILNKMYPFGYPDGTVIPTRYERLQIKLAIELYTQRGAEGQSSHTENSISRTFNTTSRILAQILPHVGSVIDNV